MVDQFAKDLLSAWLDLGLPLTTGAGLAARVSCVVTVPERRHYNIESVISVQHLYSRTMTDDWLWEAFYI